MKSREIRQCFLDFFRERGHAIVSSSSLVSGDPSVLLTTAGMQQFKRYYTRELSAESDFGLLNVATVQKCFRTSDIDEVGDETHNTFFEMLGNFSFGGYFKREAIEYAYQFMTKEMNLRIDYVTCFEGDENISKDTEAEGIWKEIKEREGESFEIRFYGREDNFWGPTGKTGPCGPTTEIYVKGVEIWNVVFNEFYKTESSEYLPIEDKGGLKGIDTGMGLERLLIMKQGVNNIFETDLFKEMMSILPSVLILSQKRIICDHIRGAVFLISDGVRPSNKETGYVLRRLLRRIIFYTRDLDKNLLNSLIDIIYNIYHDFYEIEVGKAKEIITLEREKFEQTLSLGINELNKLEVIDAKKAFYLYESFGLPFEIIKEVSGNKADGLVLEEFEKLFEEHRDKSRLGVEKKFGGHGLILDTGEMKAGNQEELAKVLRLHTATHILQYALRKVLGNTVNQMGSDITPARARFDFSFERKLTDEEIILVEKYAKELIEKNLPVKYEKMKKSEAEKTGALRLFSNKYPEEVKVYYIGDSIETAYSKEFCGGPHVEQTSEIGKIIIKKQEAVGSGVRRIKIVVE
ncbi:MAG: hypothetical protein COV57_01945 [Candidatus Liptonbacteria bacterium CG11_big_fil_rev_8_21_14_0_20_35_14]|uniref:alanine--tRNA ligase n=1 Tax=Candidatus Liptonbacteria bacterium CG11_big_fil_rev_8_21_14_0_20_35_14 TaxID=1974634 RepID=A0A2H0N7Q1_9BACT|nr:MAG: hypothetical protein COV57_01945 [Candidatus Liptonbacteria bacterium CG11_big_fil_rev_8_21_14_0_20_35_14]